MSMQIPKTREELLAWTWAEIEPLYKKLAKAELSASNVEAWLADWSRLSEAVTEQNNHWAVATTVDTANKEAKKIQYIRNQTKSSHA